MKNVVMMLQCEECEKLAVSIFTKKKLTVHELTKFEHVLSAEVYTCGVSLLDLELTGKYAMFMFGIFPGDPIGKLYYIAK